MADRGRDLKFSILSDLSQLETDTAARSFEKVGDAAQDAGRKLGGLDRDVERLALDDLGDDARRSARGIDDAFDTIARASRRSSKAVEADVDDVKGKLRDVGDEARSSAAEAFSSFDGSLDSFADGLTEVAAEAGDMFGPAGLAIGGALAVGANIFYEGYKQKQEQLAELLAEFTDEMIENNGRVSAEFINTRIAALGAEQLREFDQVARDAGISAKDFIRAVSGDPAAIERVNERLAEQRTQMEALGTGTGAEFDAASAVFGDAQKRVREELGLTNEALDGSRSAYQIAKDAMEEPIEPSVDGRPAVGDAAATAAAVAAILGRPVITPTGVTGPPQWQLDAIRSGIQRGLGTIVVPVRAGQSPYANTADNARYRD